MRPERLDQRDETGEIEFWSNLVEWERKRMRGKPIMRWRDELVEKAVTEWMREARE